MDEGAFRLLRTLARSGALPAESIPRRAGEARAVVQKLLRDRPTWFEATDAGVKCSREGLAALALEMLGREPSAPSADREAVDALRSIASRRGAPKRELDQIYADAESSVARARFLIESGDLQRGLCFVGDDDLSSLAIRLLGRVERPITVLDVDSRIVRCIEEESERLGAPVRTVEHDVREPLPKSLAGRFGCVMTDPPYAIEGFRLFIARAIELLRPDGRLCVAFGYSRRASERGLQKQRVLLEAGLVLLEIRPDFAAYEGAEAIGSRSDLYVCARTPQTRTPSLPDLDGPLYTRRSPEDRGR